jgi:hypothetical protein
VDNISTDGLFSNRKFAVKSKKPVATTAASASAQATGEDVDWDAIESEGKTEIIAALCAAAAC